MKLLNKTVASYLFVSILCIYPRASYCSPALSSVSKSEVTADTLWLLGYFARDDFPFVADSVEDKIPSISANLQRSSEYFSGITSAVHPLTVGSSSNPVTASDLRRLAMDLSDYSSRALARGKLDDSRKSLLAAISLIALPLTLTPPKSIVVSKVAGVSVLGVFSYSYTIIPASAGIRSIRASLQVIDVVPTKPLSEAKKRADLISAKIRSLSKKALPFFNLKDWGESNVENADTRAYAKLFEEELPILRRELTLLKADIDKGFDELQKQQDAKKQSAKAKPTQ